MLSTFWMWTSLGYTHNVVSGLTHYWKEKDITRSILGLFPLLSLPQHTHAHIHSHMHLHTCHELLRVVKIKLFLESLLSSFIVWKLLVPKRGYRQSKGAFVQPYKVAQAPSFTIFLRMLWRMSPLRQVNRFTSLSIYHVLTLYPILYCP